MRIPAVGYYYNIGIRIIRTVTLIYTVVLLYNRRKIIIIYDLWIMVVHNRNDNEKYEQSVSDIPWRFQRNDLFYFILLK